MGVAYLAIYRLRFPSYSPDVHEWDVILPHYIRQHGELSLASSTCNVDTSTSINFQLPWTGSILLIRYRVNIHLIYCSITLCVHLCMRMANLTGDGLQ